MDTFGFLNQNPVPGFLAIVLIPLFLIVLYVMALYVRASRRVKKLSGDATAAAQSAAASTGPSGLDLLNQARVQYSDDELPDLAMLAPLASEKPKPTDDQITLNTGAKTRALPVLSVMRDESDGRLLVVMDGVGYRSLASQPEQKRNFTRIMKELSSLVTSADTPAAPSPSAPVSPPSSDVITAGELLSAPQSPSDTHIPPAKATSAIPRAAGPVPGDLPSYKFDDNPAVIRAGAGGFKKVEFVPPPAVDIPSAIEAYLQWRLATTGSFPGRDLHVITAPGGGVRIRIDNEYFDYVDDITDLEAKAFIKQSIEEWQDRQG